MKLIAIVLLLTVLILVIVGYDLLIKAVKRKQKEHVDELNDSLHDFWQEQKTYENLQDQIIEKKNETESTNSEQPKKSRTKTK
jgi:predicted Holliday junction resolvase-like endonuclease